MPEKIEPQLDEIRRRARRRLVGAVVLALAAAVLVPMLLESEPKPLGEDVSVRIPPVDEGKFVSKLGEKGKAAESAPPATSKAASAAPRSPDASTVASAKDVGASAPKPPAEPAPASKPPPVKDPASPGVAPAAASPSGTSPAKPANENVSASSPDAAKSTAGAFSVQLAAFADDKGANALANRLKKAGHPAYTEPYTTSRGTLWRVRVGPYATREAAETARTKLKTEGQNGIIAAG